MDVWCHEDAPGDAKEALDTLIEAHHQYSDHVAKGSGLEPGIQDIEALLGTAPPVPQSLVSLLDPDQGEASDYPVLVSTPDTTSAQRTAVR